MVVKNIQYTIIGNSSQKNFNGDYNNLFNKPQFPDSLSQLKNDMGYSQIDLDAIEDWVTMLIDESEISYEGKYAEKHSVDKTSK